MTLDDLIRRNPDAGLAALDWATAHAAEIAVACKAVGVSPLEFGGLVIDAAMLAAHRGELAELGVSAAVERALSRARDANTAVSRGHKGRPRCVSLDAVAVDALPAGADPLAEMLAAESEREREDWADDHDDRLSPEAERCARGLPPVPKPSCSESTLRRRRAAARRGVGKQSGFDGYGWEV